MRESNRLSDWANNEQKYADGKKPSDRRRSFVCVCALLVSWAKIIHVCYSGVEWYGIHICAPFSFEKRPRIFKKVFNTYTNHTHSQTIIKTNSWQIFHWTEKKESTDNVTNVKAIAKREEKKLILTLNEQHIINPKKVRTHIFFFLFHFCSFEVSYSCVYTHAWIYCIQ